LKYLITEEGRVVKSGTNWIWEYNQRDHLGDVCTVVRRNSTTGLADLVQDNHYFPFGMLMSDISTSSADNRFRYNGKEYQHDLNLEWYDYGARFYDPALARWHSMDPMAEKYNTMSPYLYGFNSPLNVIDPDGRDCIFTIQRDKKGDITSVKISSTIYITGAGANQKRADALNKGTSDVFKSSDIQSNVNVSFDINYKYSADIQSDDLKRGENMLTFLNKESSDDDRSHITERRPIRSSDGKRIELTGNTGEIYKEEWDNKYTVYHESMHFLGLSDRYSNTGPHIYFGNDIMGHYGSYNIGDSHFQNFLNYNRAMNNLYPGKKSFINISMIDKTLTGDLYPATKKQIQQNP